MGALWVLGSEGLGLSLGLNVALGGIPIDQETLDLLTDAGVEVPALTVVPLPHFQLWFRI